MGVTDLVWLGTSLVIVKPETVIRWHNQGFTLYWRWLSRSKRTGRPKIPVIGSIRRECLDHVIILSEAHLTRILTEYIDCYHTARPHQSLDHNAPIPRSVEPLEQGRVVAEPVLGGVHHRYRRAA